MLDGGLATELERRGHDLGGGLWSARLLRADPGAIEDVHRAVFAAAGIGFDDTTRLLALSVELARRARDAARPGGLVAASVGPYAVMLADGSEYTGDYRGATRAAIAAVQRPRIAALLGAAPDLLAFETIPVVDEVAVLAELLAEHPGAVAWITFCCRDGARLSDGSPVEDAAAVAAASGRFAALGVNCTAPEHIDELLGRLRAVTALPLVVYPNAGRAWNAVRRAWGPGGADRFDAAAVAGWRAHGATAIGGCCGIGPDGIAAVAAALSGS